MSHKPTQFKGMIGVSESRFMGELMTCCMCGRKQLSHPKVETHWRGIEVDDDFFYVCPDELPKDADKPTSEDYRKAYAKVFDKIGLGKRKE